MFERYTEKALRIIFFARYEASHFGSPYIETEHLLLGLVREDKTLTNRFLRPHASVESIRPQIEERTPRLATIATSVDLPLTDECKRVLAYAAEEAERLTHQHIGTEHLLLGMLREEKSFTAAILTERGLRLSAVREDLLGYTETRRVKHEQDTPAGTSSAWRRADPGPPASPPSFDSVLRELCRSQSQLATLLMDLARSQSNLADQLRDLAALRGKDEPSNRPPEDIREEREEDGSNHPADEDPNIPPTE